MRQIEEGTVAAFVINVIEDGVHVAANIDTTTTRLSTHASAAPVVTTISTGVYRIKFTGLSPALSISDNADAVTLAVNGDIAGTAWSEYHIGVKIVAPERGTDNASTFDHTTDDVNTNAASRTASQATGFSTHSAADVYTEFTTGSNEDAFKADVSALATAASITALNDPTAAEVADAVWDEQQSNHITAGSFGAYLDATVSTAGGGDSAATIYTYFTDGTREDAFKADVSALATQASVNTIDTNVDAILVDTNDLQTNQGNWLTATGFSTHSAADVYTQFTSGANEDVFKADVSGLATSAEISALNDPTPAEIYNHFTAGTNEDAFKADVSGLSTHSAADVVAALQAVANDFKADISALASQASVDTIDSIVDAIKAKTDQLAFTVAGQVDANALTGGGGATAAEVYSEFTSGTNADAFKADVSGLATQTSVDSIDGDIQNIGSDVSTILTDTNELQQNQNNWLTATGFSTHSAADVYTEFTNLTNADAFKADVSSLLTDANFNAALPSNFSTLIIGTGADAGKVTTSNPAAGAGSSHTAQDVANLILATPANKLATNATGQVESSNMRGTDNALLAASAPTNWSLMAINGSGEITTSNPAAGAGSAHTAADVAALILANPANLLSTNASGQVESSNMRGTDNASTHSAADVYTEFTSGSNEDVFKADVSALATSAEIAALNDPTPAEIYTHFTAGTNEDAFKADVSGLSTHAASDVVTALQAVANDFKADVSGLATAASITALNDVSASEIYTHFTAGTNEDAFKADVSALATQASVNTIDSNVDAIKVKTDQLAFTVAGQVDANALTGGGGDDAATIYTYFTDGTREDAFKANVSGLATSAEVTGLATSAEIAALNDITAAEVYTYFTDGTREDAFKANVSGLATSSDITALNDPTAAAIADAVWNEAIADHQNVGSTGEALAGADAPTAAEVYSFFTSGTNEDAFKADVSALASQASVTNLNNIDAADVYNYFTSSSRQDLFKADTSGLASQSSVNTIDSNVDSIKAKTDQFTFTVSGQVDANALTGGGGDDAATIYDYFVALSRQDAFKADVSGMALQSTLTALNDVSESSIYDYFVDLSREDAFKADVSGLAQSSDVPANFSSLVIDGSGHVTTSNPSVGGGSAHTAADVAALILETPANKIVTNTDGQVEASNGGGGGSPTGSGAISHSVTVKVGGAPLAGADVWITSDQAGNNVVAGTLVTGVTGVVTFQLDPGNYYQWVQLAGYNFVNPSSITVQ